MLKSLLELLSRGLYAFLNAFMYLYLFSALGFFLVKDDAIMYFSGKAYKPTDAHAVQALIAELRPRIRNDDYSFVDLGAGHGQVLAAMRDAVTSSGDAPLFQRVIGVEIDEATYRQAIQKVDDPSIELVCADMFDYVKEACAQSRLLTCGRAVFFLYEPLVWASLPKRLRDQQYDRLLTDVGAHPGSIVVYISVRHIPRHIEQSMFERRGFSLQHAASVGHLGVLAKLAGTHNTLEIWRV